jgi:hypothetical protein
MERIDIRQFSPVTLADQPLIESFLSRRDVFQSAYSFINMFIWGEISQTRWKLQEDRLWIYSEREDLMLMPPGNPLSPAELLQVSDALRDAGKSGDFALVDNELVAVHPELAAHFAAEVDTDNADYIYLTQKLVQLKGRKLGKKKNLLSQFLAAAGGYLALRLEPRDAAACFDLSEKWCRMKNCERLGFTHETSAMKKALDHFATLKLEGLKILLKKEMIAFSIFSPLNRDTADIHFEKFDPGIKGSGQAINWETARTLTPRFKYLNREQDLGIEGLRQAKRSYDPECVLATFRFRRRI